MTVEKDFYSKQEVVEVVRQVLFFGNPDYFEQGGINKNIPFPKNGTFKKAEDYFSKYYLKNNSQ